MAGERAEEARAAARWCAAGGRSRRPSRRPAASWPMKVTRPSGRTPRVAGLATSCSSAPKRSACAARQLVGERLVEHRRDPRRRARRTPRPGRPRARSAGSAPRSCARRRRGGGSWLCSTPCSAASSGSTASSSAEPVGQAQRLEHAVGRPPAAAAPPRPARREASSVRGAAAARQPLGLGVGREAELAGEARQPQRAQRVGVVGRGAEHAQPARLEVAPARRAGRSARRPRAAPPSRSR